MIDPKKELFKWGPIDGAPLYVEYFMEYFVPFRRVIKESWPDVLNFIKDGKTIILVEDQELRSRGERLFKRYILDAKEKKRIYSLWIKTADAIEGMIARAEKLEELSDDELLSLLKEYDKTHEDFWVYGLVPEFSNWGAEQILKKEILKFNKMEFIEIFEALTAPEDLSFFQKEELELLKIKLDYSDEKLEQHQKKYFWLENSYGDVKVLSVVDFKKKLDEISEEEAEKKIDEISGYAAKVKAKKAEAVKKYKVPEDVQKVAKELSYCIWWQDFRKKYIFMANHLAAQFGREIGRRNKVKFSDMKMYARRDLLELAENGKKAEDVEKRKAGYASYYHEKGDRMDYHFGKDAVDFVKPYLEVKVEKGIKEIKGLVVSKGKAKGEARILFAPKEITKMKEGDILVSPMTSPDYIIAMRKASAIVTDEGGATCHAAIVSRELGVPCIVATRIATKALKDGDMIEVDADKGVVRILGK